MDLTLPQGQPMVPVLGLVGPRHQGLLHHQGQAVILAVMGRRRRGEEDVLSTWQGTWCCTLTTAERFPTSSTSTSPRLSTKPLLANLKEPRWPPETFPRPSSTRTTTPSWPATHTPRPAGFTARLTLRVCTTWRLMHLPRTRGNTPRRQPQHLLIIDQFRTW